MDEKSQTPLDAEQSGPTSSGAPNQDVNAQTTSRGETAVESRGSTNLQAPLPPAWEELVTSDGRTYYANHVSRTTTYQRPGAQTGEDVGGTRGPGNTQEELPPAWQQLVDSEGRTYYSDHNSRTTTFQRPEGGRTGELPVGWEIVRNEEGVAYFVDHNTRTTTFDDPRST